MNGKRSSRRHGCVVVDGCCDVGRERIVVIRPQIEVSTCVIIRRILYRDLVKNRGGSRCPSKRCSPRDLVSTACESLG